MSETTTVTLADFLLARIAEDEAAANDRQIENVPTDCWDPARVLAECAAKRRIVELAAYADRFPVGPTNETDAGARAMLETVVRTLAAVHADHPDYREKWRL